MAHHIRSDTITFSHPSLRSAAPVTLEHEPDDSALPSVGGADGTNLRLWPSSLVLSKFLCEHPDLVVGKRVVELGAGSGAVGLVCAALGAESVTLTDVPDALRLIHRNVDRNAPPAGTTVRVAACEWGNRAHIDALLRDSETLPTDRGGRGYDVVLCCEVVYQNGAEVLEALAHTQHALARKATHPSAEPHRSPSKVLLAYEFRSGLTEDIAYFDAATRIFGDSTTYPLDASVGAFMGDHVDDGTDDRFLYVYEVQPEAEPNDEPPSEAPIAAPAAPQHG